MICNMYCVHRLSCLTKICFQKCLVLAVINKLEKIMAMSHGENRKILDFIMLEIYGEIPTGKFYMSSGFYNGNFAIIWTSSC